MKPRSPKMFLPQFAARAVVDLELGARRLAESPRSDELRFYRLAVSSVAKMIRQSVHIVLPDNGEIYRDNDAGGTIPSDDECESFAGIPAPVVCFQYRWNRSTELVKSEDQAYAPKRITLVLDGKQVGAPLPPGLVDVETDSITYLFSIYFDERVNFWMLTPLMLGIGQPLRCQWRTSGAVMGRWDWGPVALVRDLEKNDYLAPDNLGSSSTAVGEFRPDITAVVQACHSLRAGAYLKEHVERSGSRRKNFEKMGVGGFSYHVLKLPHQSDDSNIGVCGSHKSPRLHLRRAHIRKLPSGALTFVRQCFVGNSDNGVVDKHYQVARR